MKILNKLKERIKSKKILRDSPKATIDVSQKVYTEDKSRYFKSEYEKERKRLYFK